MIPLAIFALAALMAAAAIGLFVYAGRREHREDVTMRLRAGDEAAAAAPVTSEARKLRNPVVRWACYALWRTGAEVQPATVSGALVVLAAMVPITLLILGWMAGVSVILATVLVSLFLLNRQAARRRSKIVEQLPGFLESAMRMLAAGNTLEEAFGAAARESQEPLRTLFLSISRQVRLGAPIDQVLAEAAEINRLRDLRVLSLATNINRRYGGTLRNVFRSLIQAIRSRDAAARELKALTAETRFSALVLALLPVLIATFVYFRTRSFYDDVLATPSGRAMFITALTFQVLGVIVIYRMMRATMDPEA